MLGCERWVLRSPQWGVCKGARGGAQGSLPGCCRGAAAGCPGPARLAAGRGASRRGWLRLRRLQGRDAGGPVLPCSLAAALLRSPGFIHGACPYVCWFFPWPRLSHRKVSPWHRRQPLPSLSTHQRLWGLSCHRASRCRGQAVAVTALAAVLVVPGSPQGQPRLRGSPARGGTG